VRSQNACAREDYALAGVGNAASFPARRGRLADGECRCDGEHNAGDRRDEYERDTAHGSPLVRSLDASPRCAGLVNSYAAATRRQGWR
jgi:hypothetical protein